jgi:hypothetical protein
MIMTRRTLVTAAAGLSGAACMSAAGRARTPAGLSDLALFVRIRCQPAGQRTFWWYSGQMLARRSGEAVRPLVTVVGASQSDITVNPDGSISYALTEAGYYGDIATGMIADKPIVNALTGEMIQPEHYLSPQKLRFLPDLSVRPEIANLPPGLDYRGRITPPDRKGDYVWMAEELFVAQPASATRSVRISNSLANFQVRASDLYSNMAFVPATMQYTTVNSLRPWMNMGDTQGDVVMRINAIKLAHWSRVDAALRARIAKDHPGIFHDL